LILTDHLRKENAVAKRRAVQQEVVQEILRQNNRPLLPVDILRIAEGKGRRLGMATVYRALRSLVEDGEAVAVCIQNEPPRYESVKRRHHHHFLCRGCGMVFNIPGCLEQELARMVPAHFQMDSHDITLHGLCAGCLQMQDPGKG
jgi:Fur family ferric uptake transcriptional regulator